MHYPVVSFSFINKDYANIKPNQFLLQVYYHVDFLAINFNFNN